LLKNNKVLPLLTSADTTAAEIDSDEGKSKSFHKQYAALDNRGFPFQRTEYFTKIFEV
jgi:hypothetical protein